MKNREIRRLLCCMSICIMLMQVQAQQIKGLVYALDDAGSRQALEGANVYWMGTTIGVVSDSNGYFALNTVPQSSRLIVQYVGHISDTLNITDIGNDTISIELQSLNRLKGVTVSAGEGSYISVQPMLTQVITGDGLHTAACCSLAESFESNASVDVNYADAVTGAKQIQMLGLAGIYSQILLENTPYIRCLSLPLGLLYVPGTWMESISISKGTSSVINGYESITGQISVSYKKPVTNKEKVFVNLFLNSMLKNEVNFNTRIPVKEHVSTMVLGHFENMPVKWDHNKDGFLDVPLNTHVNVMNRWDYEKHGKLSGHTMYSYLYDTRTGGETDFCPKQDKLTTRHYGIGIQNHRFNVISKNGIILPGPDESIGTIVSFTFHDYKSYYGLQRYAARQWSAYVNVFYENFMDKNDRHKIDAGLSFQSDYITEQYVAATAALEWVPGVFAQYSYVLKDKLVAMAGFRLDYNSLYGLLWTPRLHVKWQAAPSSSFRLSAGKGYRSPHLLIENAAYMAASKTIVLPQAIQAEEAYNAGISFTQQWKIKNKTCSFIIDYYYTYFVNQVVADVDKDYTHVYFNTLHGKSYSHAAQAEIMLYPFKGMEITMAYRYTLAKEYINGSMQQKPLVAPHKAVIGVNYATKFDKWKFSLTLQMHGAARLPQSYISFFKANPQLRPSELAANAVSTPWYVTLNAQVTKKFKYVELYVGGENLTNYRQHTPIIDAANPFSNAFDATLVWGPITGIMGYAGVRFILKYLN